MSDTRSALDADELTGRMYLDPDLRGDLLAVGLAVARVIRDGDTTLVLRKIADMLGWAFPDGSPDWRRVRYVLADDRPRYVARHPAADNYCMSPMIRRDGTCDQRATGGVHLRDADTGEMNYLPTCSRHRDWGLRLQRQSVAVWHRNGGPQPPPNTGGVLARHISLDWETIYRWGDSGWKSPAASGRAAPQLRLIGGDGLGGEPGRPGLVLA